MYSRHNSHRHCQLWSYWHLLFHRCPYIQHRPFGTKSQGRHSNGENLTIHWNKRLRLTHIPSVFLIKGHLVPGFRHTLIGVGPLFDANFTVTFTREAVIVRDQQGMPVLTVWRKTSGPQLWGVHRHYTPIMYPDLRHEAYWVGLLPLSARRFSRVVALRSCAIL